MSLPQPTTNDLDAWMTEFPDEDLERLVNTVNQAADGNIQDQEAFTYILSLVLRFSGKPALAVDEITSLLPDFAVCLALESLRRQGKLVKQGKYSLIPGEREALFATIKREDTTAGQ